MTVTTALTPVPLPARTTGVSAWVDIVKPAAELARSIAATEFVPKAMRDNPAAVTACILFGAEIGIGPMQSLAKIAIIDGRPAPSAELARALVLSDGHDMWVEEATVTRVVMAGKRANSTHVQKVSWTMDDAKKAGLSGKPNWARYPRQMLLARASIELARMVAPDSLGGISVFAEELDDDAAGLIETLQNLPDGIPTAPVKRQTRRLAAAPTPVDPPPLPDEEPIPEDNPPPVPERDEPPLPPLPDEEPEERVGPTDAQIRKLMVEYNRLGIRDRVDQKRIGMTLLGLEQLASHKDLTQSQASNLIDMVCALDPFNDIVRPDGTTPYVAGSEPNQEPML